MPFGLIRADGSKKPSYDRFVEVAMTAPPIFADETIVPAGPPSYRLGFLQAYQSNPGLVGDPIQDEAWPVRGLSTQRTSAGQLFWCDLKGVGSTLLFTANDGTRYLWRSGKLERVA